MSDTLAAEIQQELEGALATIDTLDAQLAECREKIAQLEAWKKAVPLKAIWAVLDDPTVYLDPDVHDDLWEWRDSFSDEDDGNGAYECQECGSTYHPTSECPNKEASA